MSSSNTPGAPSGRGPLVIILAIIGILGIIGGILYVSGAANSIHFIDGSVYHGHHKIRAVVSFIVGIAFLIMAYIAKTRPAQTRPAQTQPPAGTGQANVTGAGPAGSAGPTSSSGPASTAGPASGPGTTTGSGSPTTPSGT